MRQFDDKSVLVTGGTGSFGRRFIDTLLRHSRGAPPHRVLARRVQAVRDAAASRPRMQRPHALLHRRRARRRAARAGDPRGRRHRPCRGAEAGAGGRIQSRSSASAPTSPAPRTWCARRCATACKRVIALSTDKAANPINLYGASQARLRQDLHRRQQPRRQERHPLRGGALRQRRRLARQRHPALPQARRRGRRIPAGHRRPHDAVLDHAAAGRRLRRHLARHDAGRRDLRAQDPEHAHRPISRAPWARACRSRSSASGPARSCTRSWSPRTISRQTLELADRYIIEPAFAWWRRDSYVSTGAVPVAQGFRFASDTNTDWLDEERLAALLDAA